MVSNFEKSPNKRKSFNTPKKGFSPNKTGTPNLKAKTPKTPNKTPFKKNNESFHSPNEKVKLNKTDIAEGESFAKTPAKTPNKFTPKTPGKTPAKTPNKFTPKTPGKTPAKTPNKFTPKTPGKTPAKTPKTPVENVEPNNQISPQSNKKRPLVLNESNETNSVSPKKQKLTPVKGNSKLNSSVSDSPQNQSSKKGLTPFKGTSQLISSTSDSPKKTLQSPKKNIINSNETIKKGGEVHENKESQKNQDHASNQTKKKRSRRSKGKKNIQTLGKTVVPLEEINAKIRDIEKRPVSKSGKRALRYYKKLASLASKGVVPLSNSNQANGPKKGGNVKAGGNKKGNDRSVKGNKVAKKFNNIPDTPESPDEDENVTNIMSKRQQKAKVIVNNKNKNSVLPDSPESPDEDENVNNIMSKKQQKNKVGKNKKNSSTLPDSPESPDEDENVTNIMSRKQQKNKVGKNKKNSSTLPDSPESPDEEEIVTHIMSKKQQNSKVANKKSSISPDSPESPDEDDDSDESSDEDDDSPDSDYDVENTIKVDKITKKLNVIPDSPNSPDEEDSDEDDDDDDDDDEDDDDDDDEDDDEEKVEGNQDQKMKNAKVNKNKNAKPVQAVHKPIQGVKTNTVDAQKNKNVKQLINATDGAGNNKTKSRYVLFIGNISYETNKNDIVEHFKKAGEIVDVRIPLERESNKPRGFAFVEVKDEESYQKVLSMHNTSMNGRRINVLYTQGGKKNSENKMKEIKSKNFKLQAMRNQGLLAGSVPETKKRSWQRAKAKNSFSEKKSN